MNLWTGDAKISFGDPRKPFIARMAGRMAKKHDVTFVTDWGNDSWDTNPKVADAHTETMTMADIIILPDDAVVKNMSNKVRNPKELMGRTRSQYKNAAGEEPRIIMSNGDRNVQVFDGQKIREIEVPKFKGAKHVNGIGDWRNAVLLKILAENEYDFFEAAQIATIMASLYAQYPDRTCINHIGAHASLFNAFNRNATIQAPSTVDSAAPSVRTNGHAPVKDIPQPK